MEADIICIIQKPATWYETDRCSWQAYVSPEETKLVCLEYPDYDSARRYWVTEDQAAAIGAHLELSQPDLNLLTGSAREEMEKLFKFYTSPVCNHRQTVQDAAKYLVDRCHRSLGSREIVKEEEKMHSIAVSEALYQALLASYPEEAQPEALAFIGASTAIELYIALVKHLQKREAVKVSACCCSPLPTFHCIKLEVLKN